MQRVMLSAKLHRVRVTATELDYEGSVAIDAELLAAADIREYEQVHIYNVANGERFTSYAVVGAAGEISVLGAAARRVSVNDTLIICTYASLTEVEAQNHQPRKVYVDKNNRITHTDPQTHPQQLAV